MLVSSDRCTGCSACARACPTGAITIALNADGFFVPQIRQSACIHCRKCEQVCPVGQTVTRNQDMPVKGYACSLKDTQQIAGSTSGGLFYALAREVLLAGGTVFGAVLTSELRVEHRAAASVEELEELRKSKYVQSDLKDAFAQVKKLLEAGAPVLFSGTPCQCAGLYSYLGHEEENLLMVELFCGQVTGYLTWGRYLAWLQKNKDARPRWFGFREKPHSGPAGNNLGLIAGGWKDPYTKVEYDGAASETRQWLVDKWTVAYVNNLMQRPSCGQCKFKQQSGFNYADIAIGDFWGVENNAPKAFDANGTSAALAYTQKGAAWLEKARKWLRLTEVDIAAIRRGNPAVWTSARPHPKQEHFLELLRAPDADFALALRECLGADRSCAGEGVRFGIWGGFNIRRAVFDASNLCNGSVAYHISNVSLISQAAAPLPCPARAQLPANPLRADMLKLDFDKTAFTQATADRLRQADYLVIDFMEERFPALAYGGSYITGSDALHDSALAVPAASGPEGYALTERWKESCRRFIAQLRKFYTAEQIILVRSLLSAQYEEKPGCLRPFDGSGLPCSIPAMNAILDQKYDYFLAHCPTQKVITLRPDSLFCEYNHKHGVVPSHSNGKSTQEIKTQLYAFIKGVSI